MNAIQPSRPQPSRNLPPRRRSASRVLPQGRKAAANRAMALELTVKLAVNLVLLSAAIAALVRILPYQSSQQEKLRELSAEVNATETRVDRLRLNFNRNFDPQQARNVMQEQSYRVDPRQRQVVWLDRQSARGSEKTP
ncbi:hypothetical protein [Geitlerinema sp. PCC 7407]|uniref:slr1601 family putative cell division protein n=1 Tax=Geitlerinema sp. PCC 7407 TaxID=1173025 RepID=UPI00029F8600|nr:hypothetical protein [Geitlerinema sp. PCC 7407]AFY65162.1 hypothetical protein GEI7407_0664 [Geitlerinema sp. PCC 7407]